MKLSGATSLVGVTAIFGAAISSAAVAQQSDDTAALMAMDVGSLRTEVQARYDRALAASLDPAYVNASDSRYLWAIEAKAQCGIALGFLKSSTGAKPSDGGGAPAGHLRRQDADPYLF